MIGQMDPFDDAGEQWAMYIERFEHYILADDIQPEKRVPVLLSVMGPKTYGLLCNLVAPNKPGTMQYDNIVGVLQAHFAPKPLVIAERFRFHKRNQGEEETVAQYVAVLKRLSEHCVFGAYLEDALRDRFVCGLKCETVQKRLLTEKDLTFRKACCHKNGDKCCCCGKMNHTDDDCWYKDCDCHQCGRKGHTKRMYKGRDRSSQEWNRKEKEGKPEPKGNAVKNRGKDKKRRVHHVAAEESESEGTRPDTDSELELYSLSRKEKYSHISLMPVVNVKKMEMELDTGAAVSLIPWEQYKSMLSQLPLQPTDIMLKTYTGEPLAPEGVIKVQVELNKQCATLPLYVVKVDAPPLFGREWLRVIKLNWKDLKMVHAREQSGNDYLEAVLKKHSTVFSKELGTMKGIKARLTLRPDSVLKFCPPRNAELKRLTELGVITPVEHSDWATPVVPVNKKDGSVRLCGDFKVTLNSQLCVDKYPLPRIEDLFASLAGGQHFSKLDLANAYLQMEVEEESKATSTLMFSLRFGLLSTLRRCFPQGKTQRFGNTLENAYISKRSCPVAVWMLENTHCYLDDILVSGPDKQTHLRTLEAVLSRLEDYGLHLKQEKCLFFQESVEYLGHIIDVAGLHKSTEKVRAVMEAPAPADVSQLHSFLGMLNYYGRFIPDLATVLKPLNELLSKEKKWQWTSACESAFQKAKERLASPEILTHYNPELPLCLACDASPYGVGTVLSHIEREASAIVFGVRKFHQYLHGNKFTLLTDHRPLTSILSPVKGTPSMAAARMQRWALLLIFAGNANFSSYTLQYRQGAHHANADGLSRLPLPLAQEEKRGAVEVLYTSQLDTLPVSVAEIRRDTVSDVTLSCVLEMVTTGRFPAAKDTDHELSSYLLRRQELTIQQGCLMWGVKVAVPPKLRSHVLKELHTAHPGVVRMKSFARSYVWWPDIDSQIELQAKACHTCQRVQKEPGLAPLDPWLWPSCPWEWIHVDFAGPFEGHMYLVVVDAHSKWPEVHIMDSTTTGKTIQVLQGLFSRHGIPVA
ncbi:DDB1- and CUL4-associated factor 15 [Sarotherodon galilaeus]